MSIAQHPRVDFYPDVETVGQIGLGINEDVDTLVRDEPMLFTASVDFAWENGGSLMHRFLTAINDRIDPDRTIIDCRSHMLMEGWYPCIPGWHLDHIPRNTATGQPDYISLPQNDEHYMLVTGTAESWTQFLDSVVFLRHPADGELVYESFNKQINRLIERGMARTFTAEPDHIYRFGPSDFHRGMPSPNKGWRWFVRLSHTDKKPANEIRKQVQVYLPEPEKGW